MDAEFRQRIAACPQLPSIPAVAANLLRLVQDDAANLEQVAQQISQDPALSVKLLRLVNSPLYSLRNPISSITGAVTMLGLTATRTLVLGFQLVETLPSESSFGFDFVRFWRRSLAGGVAARVVGRWLHLAQAEDLFLAGLLQDLGMLVLATAIPRTYGQLVERAGQEHRRLQALERTHFGADHASLGAWMARRWNLPPLTCFCIEGSHAPSEIDAPGSLRVAVRAVALSGVLADVWISGDPRAAYRRARVTSKAMLGMPPRTFHGTLTTIGKALPEIARLFDVPVGKIERLESLLKAPDSGPQRSRPDVRTLETPSPLTAASGAGLFRDPLTGTRSPAYLQQYLPGAMEQANRLRRPLTVACCELDHLREIKRDRGLAIGERALQHVARILSAGVRRRDVVGYTGKGGFILVLPDTGASVAEAVCKRILQEVVNLPFSPGGAPRSRVELTLSIGVATHSVSTPYEDVDALTRDGARALTEARRRGRNRCVTSAELSRPSRPRVSVSR